MPVDDRGGVTGADWLPASGVAQAPDRTRKVQLAIKRLIDIVGGCALLVVLGPLILAAALLIRMGSRGPAFYTGKRWGFCGKQFACIKLRTMYVNQAEILARNNLAEMGDMGRLLLFEQDPRITRIGAVLRKLSIDELPQLLNVVKGDMSLIGPRPLAIAMLEQYPQLCAARAVMRPGITGLWQVRNRMKNASVFDMIDDDVEYTQTFSLILDVKIVCWTFPRIIEPAVDVKR